MSEPKYYDYDIVFLRKIGVWVRRHNGKWWEIHSSAGWNPSREVDDHRFGYGGAVLVGRSGHWPLPIVEASSLAAMQENYLAVRQHTLSTAHLTGADQLMAEAEYVLGEARELDDAVAELCDDDWRHGEYGPARDGLLREVRHEIADVALAIATLAKFLDVTVEDCIAEKTEADRGRG